MEIRRATKNKVLILELAGRLDELATSEVERAFTTAIKDGVKEIVVDLAGVEYVSSSGLRVLLMLSRAIQRIDGRLKLSGLSPFVAEVFDVANFNRVFSIHHTSADALNALAVDNG